jgi:hypothetical protein
MNSLFEMFDGPSLPMILSIHRMITRSRILRSHFARHAPITNKNLLFDAASGVLHVARVKERRPAAAAGATRNHPLAFVPAG